MAKWKTLVVTQAEELAEKDRYFAAMEAEHSSAYRQLKSTVDWTLVTADNLPKVGDEVLRVRISTGEVSSRIEFVAYDWDAGCLQARPVYREYRRPLNLTTLGVPHA